MGNPLSSRLMRIGVWSGAVLVSFWILALVGGGFIPPKTANTSAVEITEWYQDNETRLRIATVVLMITGSFWATWGAVLGTLVRRMETDLPILTYMVVALVGGGYVFFEFVALFWGVAAYRPGDLSPETTLTLHDLGWFSVLFDWPPFALFNIVLAVAILKDKSQIFDRWVGYMSIWCACIFVPAGAIIFFEDGPLAYSGVFALYIPLGVFFLWMCGITYGTLRAINRLEERDAAAAAVVAEAERAREPVVA